MPEQPDYIVHTAEQFLPIPQPEFDGLPPTMQAEMAHPTVAQAQQAMRMSMLKSTEQQTEQQEWIAKFQRAARIRATQGRRRLKKGARHKRRTKAGTEEEQ